MFKYSFNFLGSDFFLFVRAALVIMKPNCSQNLAPKMGPPHSPLFGTYGAISAAVPKQGSMELGGQNWVPQKHKLRPKIGANFSAPLLAPFAYRVMLFQNTLINPACQAETWEGHMTRPFFQPKSSPISRSMKPR